MRFKKVLIILLLVFSAIHSKEFEHPIIDYNKGLEYYNQKDFGKAMFYAKRAFLLRPSDSNIRTLFYNIRQSIGMPPIYSKDRLDQKFFTTIFGSFPPHIFALLGSILLVLVVTIISLKILKKITYSKYISLLLMFVLFIGIVSIINSLVLYYGIFLQDHRVVLKNSQSYEEPDKESSLLLQIPAGTEITVIAESNRFVLLKTLDGKEFWMEAGVVPPLWESNI